MIDVGRAFTTFIIAFAQVVIAALSVGFLPALWMIAVRKRYLMLAVWTLLWLACVTALVYALPLAMREWKAWLGGRFWHPEPMYLGYFIGLLGAFYFFPEPMRIARNRLRRESRHNPNWNDEPRRKKRRKKRRSNQGV